MEAIESPRNCGNGALTAVPAIAIKTWEAAALEEIRRRATIQYERCAQIRSLLKHLTRNLPTHNLNTLLIGFARRFAVYKQAGLVFRDLERLAQLVNDPQRPLTLVFAGKAHPNNEPGQALLRKVYEISQLPGAFACGSRGLSQWPGCLRYRR